MSQYYKIRTRNLYDPKSSELFRISRSKIDLFIKCPRCFYLDRRLGIGQPPGYPFSLNSAVDTLLKKEFDMHRAKGTAHPLMKAYGLDAVPMRDERMDSLTLKTLVWYFRITELVRNPYRLLLSFPGRFKFSWFQNGTN